jgi:hypothetical protein
MTTYLFEKLFQPKDLSTINLYDELRPLMLSGETKKNENTKLFIEQNKIQTNHIDRIENTEIISKQTDVSEFKKPNQKNTLFWCAYIAKNGYDEYNQIKCNHGSLQIDIQRNIIEYTEKNKVLLKELNIRITNIKIQEIMSELSTLFHKTDIYVLYAIVVYYHINIVLLHPSEEYYLEIFSDTNSVDVPVYLIKKDENNNYLVKDSSLSVDDYVEMKETKFQLYNHLKPLKAISKYKVSELQDIADKLDIDIYSKKRSKNELYNDISQIIKWD